MARRRVLGTARAAFTLVELLVVIGVIGVLVGLLLPAVQRARESGRRTACLNNLRGMTLGVGAYESSRRHFPTGNDAVPVLPGLPIGTQHAWSSLILPYIEQGALASRIDFRKFWNAAGGNDTASDAFLGIYICPSGMVSYVGKQDYGGVTGTYIVPSDRTQPVDDPFHNGTLVFRDADHQQSVTPASVTDGLSQTLLIGESVDRGQAPAIDVNAELNSRWALGTNCFAQNARFINVYENENLRSRHDSGSHASFADGRAAFLNENMDPDVLAAICTRNGGETKSSAASAP
jgi:hypothetical protein